MARKPVRSPFVVTVAVLGATLTACGGQVSPDPNATADTGGDTEVQPDTELPFLKTCPSVRPATGSACRVESTLTCDYGMCSDSALMQCSPDTSTWKNLGGVSCNPPPPVCPEVPFEGAPCKPGRGDCAYPDKCEARPPDAPSMRYWACSGDRLVSRDITTDYVVACPAAAPRHGDPCTCAGHYPGPCSYGDCFGSPTISATCDERTMTWSVAERSCNPPAPDAG